MITNPGEKNKMLQNIFRNNFKIMRKAGTRTRARPQKTALALLGLGAGVLNGFLGTGGGMVLSVGLRALAPGEDRESLATATASVMFLSLLSTILYLIDGRIGSADILPVIFPALLGGALGALMLGKLRHEVIELLLGGMLLYSGLALLL